MAVTVTLTDEQWKTLGNAIADAIEYRAPETWECGWCKTDHHGNVTEMCEDHLKDQIETNKFLDLQQALVEQQHGRV